MRTRRVRGQGVGKQPRIFLWGLDTRDSQQHLQLLTQTGPTIPGHLRLSAERVFEQEQGVRGGRFHDVAGITVEVP